MAPEKIIVIQEYICFDESTQESHTIIHGQLLLWRDSIKSNKYLLFSTCFYQSRYFRLASPPTYIALTA